MYLKNDKIVATLKNIQFRSFKTGSGPQYILDPTALTGWDDGANVRRDATVRPVSSGDFTEPYTFAARLITFTGAALATSRGELQRMRDALTGVLQFSEYAALSVETTAGIRFATVGLENSVSWVQQSDTVALFKLDLYAPDPKLYGPEKRQKAGSYIVSGGLEFPLSYPLDYHLDEDNVYTPITNYGNTTAYPIFIVIGDFYSGFSIQDHFGGNTVTYNGMVTKSAPVTIDMGRGTATQNGADKTVLVTRREWFGIPPQTTLAPIFAPTDGGQGAAGLGWCDIIYRDTWI